MFELGDKYNITANVDEILVHILIAKANVLNYSFVKFSTVCPPPFIGTPKRPFPLCLCIAFFIAKSINSFGQFYAPIFYTDVGTFKMF